MIRRNYNIIMETPLGKKRGGIQLNITGDKIDGEIYILDVAQPFSGTLDKKGNCKLHGSLKTPTKEIPYEAMGNMGDLHIDLLMNSSVGLFHVKSF